MAVPRIENASDFDPKRFSLEALEMLTYITLLVRLGGFWPADNFQVL